MNEKLLYVSSGKKNGMYTLRQQWEVQSYMHDDFIKTLAKDRDEATAKAWEYFQVHCPDCDGWVFGGEPTFDLYEWGHGKPVWVLRALEQIEHGVLPFGKHVGELIEDQDTQYILWWASKELVNENLVVQTLVRKFHAIATARGLWEEAEKANREKAKAKEISQYVGEIGKRQKFQLQMEFYRPFDGYYGPAIVIGFLDKDRNKVVYIGSADFSDVQVGDSVEFEAKVTQHKEYMGEKQTIVNRPTKKVKITKED